MFKNFLFSYFIGTGINSPGEQHLYRTVKLHTTSSPFTPDCLTCTNHSSLPPCLHSRVLLSPDYTGYLLSCQGPSIPYTVLVSLPSNTVHTILDRNTHITQLVKERNMPVTQTISLKSEQAETPGLIRIKLVMPKVEKDHEQLAVVVMMAKTPGEQQVDHQWGCRLECYLASSSQVVVAMVDVRGSAGQGTSWQQSVRGRLGVMESQDMEQVVRFLTGL